MNETRRTVLKRTGVTGALVVLAAARLVASGRARVPPQQESK
jgi:hypothetical protein